ncbi:MAG: cyclase family protein [Candidatus Dormibacteria bacterium]
MRVVDLTHTYEDSMPLMAGIARPTFRDIALVAEDGYSMSEYSFINHSGTHIDAPSHQIAGGATLDEIPLERLVTDAFVVDLKAHVPGPVSAGDLKDYLPRVRRNDIVLFCSGNSDNWGSESYWHGWCYPDASATAALIELEVSGVGLDGPSADPVESQTYDLHRLWLSSGRFILENLADLRSLPERCRIVVAPLKVRGANGAPARVLAFLDEEMG